MSALAEPQMPEKNMVETIATIPIAPRICPTRSMARLTMRRAIPAPPHDRPGENEERDRQQGKGIEARQDPLREDDQEVGREVEDPGERGEAQGDPDRYGEGERQDEREGDDEAHGGLLAAAPVAPGVARDVVEHEGASRHPG